MGEARSGFAFEDRWIPAAEGASLGAALWAAGERAFRRTRGAGAARSLFCGIGNCFDCLVDLPGRSATRSCVTPMETGVAVRASRSLGAPTADPPDRALAAADHEPAPRPARNGAAATGVRPASEVESAKQRLTVDVAATGGGPASEVGTTKQRLTVDVAVVGAGPAGLAAASAAGELGVSVALVDAAPAPGGNIWRAARHDSGGGTGPPRRYRDLSAGVTVLGSTQVVVAEGRPGGGARLHLDGHPDVAVLDTPAVVLATGATEVVQPFPGWDLPGVITAGAAQALLKGDGVVAGERVLVAGTGPLLLAVAADLAAAGAQVTLAEAARPRSQLRALSMAARHPAKVAQAFGLAARLARHRVRPLTGRRLAAVRALPGGTLMARLAPERWLAVDAVCVHHGLAPDVALARALGCTTTTDPVRGEIAVRVDDDQATDRPGVFAAGEITGVAGAPAAEAEGTVAGLAAALHARTNQAEDAGESRAPAAGSGADQAEGAGTRLAAAFHAGAGQAGGAAGGSRGPAAGSGAVGGRLVGARRRAARERRFGEVLARMWPAPAAWWQHVEPDTTVCRCEEVAWSSVVDAVAGGAADLRAVKGRTRVGMGLCQGRVCGPPLQLAVAAIGGRPVDQVGDLASRPIAVPVTLARLAGLSPAASDPGLGGPT